MISNFQVNNNHYQYQYRYRQYWPCNYLVSDQYLNLQYCPLILDLNNLPLLSWMWEKPYFTNIEYHKNNIFIYMLNALQGTFNWLWNNILFNMNSYVTNISKSKPQRRWISATRSDPCKIIILLEDIDNFSFLNKITTTEQPSLLAVG